MRIPETAEKYLDFQNAGGRVDPGVYLDRSGLPVSPGRLQTLEDLNIGGCVLLGGSAVVKEDFMTYAYSVIPGTGVWVVGSAEIRFRTGSRDVFSSSPTWIPGHKRVPFRFADVNALGGDWVYLLGAPAVLDHLKDLHKEGPDGAFWRFLENWYWTLRVDENPEPLLALVELLENGEHPVKAFVRVAYPEADLKVGEPLPFVRASLAERIVGLMREVRADAYESFSGVDAASVEFAARRVARIVIEEHS